MKSGEDSWNAIKNFFNKIWELLYIWFNVFWGIWEFINIYNILENIKLQQKYSVMHLKEIFIYKIFTTYEMKNIFKTNPSFSAFFPLQLI